MSESNDNLISVTYENSELKVTQTSNITDINLLGQNQTQNIDQIDQSEQSKHSIPVDITSSRQDLFVNHQINDLEVRIAQVKSNIRSEIYYLDELLKAKEFSYSSRWNQFMTKKQAVSSSVKTSQISVKLSFDAVKEGFIKFLQDTKDMLLEYLENYFDNCENMKGDNKKPTLIVQSVEESKLRTSSEIMNVINMNYSSLKNEDQIFSKRDLQKEIQKIAVILERIRYYKHNQVFPRDDSLNLIDLLIDNTNQIPKEQHKLSSKVIRLSNADFQKSYKLCQKILESIEVIEKKEIKASQVLGHKQISFKSNQLSNQSLSLREATDNNPQNLLQMSNMLRQKEELRKGLKENKKEIMYTKQKINPNLGSMLIDHINYLGYSFQGTSIDHTVKQQHINLWMRLENQMKSIKGKYDIEMELYSSAKPPLCNSFRTDSKELAEKKSISWLAIVIPFSKLLCENVSLIIRVFSKHHSDSDCEAKSLLGVQKSRGTYRFLKGFSMVNISELFWTKDIHCGQKVISQLSFYSFPQSLVIEEKFDDLIELFSSTDKSTKGSFKKQFNEQLTNDLNLRFEFKILSNLRQQMNFKELRNTKIVLTKGYQKGSYIDKIPAELPNVKMQLIDTNLNEIFINLCCLRLSEKIHKKTPLVRVEIALRDSFATPYYTFYQTFNDRNENFEPTFQSQIMVASPTVSFKENCYLRIPVSGQVESLQHLYIIFMIQFVKNTFDNLSAVSSINKMQVNQITPAMIEKNPSQYSFETVYFTTLPLFDFNKKIILSNGNCDDLILKRFHAPSFLEMKPEDSFGMFKPEPSEKLHVQINVISNEFVHNKFINSILLVEETTDLGYEECIQIFDCVKQISPSELIKFHEKILHKIFQIFVGIKNNDCHEVIFRAIIYIIHLFVEELPEQKCLLHDYIEKVFKVQKAYIPLLYQLSKISKMFEDADGFEQSLLVQTMSHLNEILWLIKKSFEEDLLVYESQSGTMMNKGGNLLLSQQQKPKIFKYLNCQTEQRDSQVNNEDKHKTVQLTSNNFNLSQQSNKQNRHLSEFQQRGHHVQKHWHDNKKDEIEEVEEDSDMENDEEESDELINFDNEDFLNEAREIRIKHSTKVQTIKSSARPETLFIKPQDIDYFKVSHLTEQEFSFTLQSIITNIYEKTHDDSSKFALALRKILYKNTVAILEKTIDYANEEYVIKIVDYLRKEFNSLEDSNLMCQMGHVRNSIISENENRESRRLSQQQTFVRKQFQDESEIKDDDDERDTNLFMRFVRNHGSESFENYVNDNNFKVGFKVDAPSDSQVSQIKIIGMGSLLVSDMLDSVSPQFSDKIVQLLCDSIKENHISNLQGSQETNEKRSQKTLLLFYFLNQLFAYENKQDHKQQNEISKQFNDKDQLDNQERNPISRLSFAALDAIDDMKEINSPLNKNENIDDDNIRVNNLLRSTHKTNQSFTDLNKQHLNDSSVIQNSFMSNNEQSGSRFIKRQMSKPRLDFVTRISDDLTSRLIEMKNEAIESENPEITKVMTPFYQKSALVILQLINYLTYEKLEEHFFEKPTRMFKLVDNLRTLLHHISFLGSISTYFNTKVIQVFVKFNYTIATLLYEKHDLLKGHPDQKQYEPVIYSVWIFQQQLWAVLSSKEQESKKTIREQDLFLFSREPIWEQHKTFTRKFKEFGEALILRTIDREKWLPKLQKTCVEQLYKKGQTESLKNLIDIIFTISEQDYNNYYSKVDGQSLVSQHENIDTHFDKATRHCMDDLYTLFSLLERQKKSQEEIDKFDSLVKEHSSLFDHNPCFQRDFDKVYKQLNEVFCLMKTFEEVDENKNLFYKCYSFAQLMQKLADYQLFTCYQENKDYYQDLLTKLDNENCLSEKAQADIIQIDIVDQLQQVMSFGAKGVRQQVKISSLENIVSLLREAKFYTKAITYQTMIKQTYLDQYKYEEVAKALKDEAQIYEAIERDKQSITIKYFKVKFHGPGFPEALQAPNGFVYKDTVNDKAFSLFNQMVSDIFPHLELKREIPKTPKVPGLNYVYVEQIKPLTYQEICDFELKDFVDHEEEFALQQTLKQMTNKRQIEVMSQNNKQWFTSTSPMEMPGVDADLLDFKVDIYKVENRFPSMFHMQEIKVIKRHIDKSVDQKYRMEKLAIKDLQEATNRMIYFYQESGTNLRDLNTELSKNLVADVNGGINLMLTKVFPKDSLRDASSEQRKKLLRLFNIIEQHADQINSSLIVFQKHSEDEKSKHRYVGLYGKLLTQIKQTKIESGVEYYQNQTSHTKTLSNSHMIL